MENNYHIIVKRNDKIYAEAHDVSEEITLNILDGCKGDRVEIFTISPEEQEQYNLMFGELIHFIDLLKEEYEEDSDLKMDNISKRNIRDILDYIMKYAERLEEKYE